MSDYTGRIELTAVTLPKASFSLEAEGDRPAPGLAHADRLARAGAPNRSYKTPRQAAKELRSTWPASGACLVTFGG